MEPISKPILDRAGLRLPTNVKHELRNGDLNNYDVLNLMGNTINAVAEAVDNSVERLEGFAGELAEKEEERIDNERERIHDEDKRKDAEHVREQDETVRKRNEKWRQQNESERMDSENIRIANENERISNEEVREADEEKRIELYNEAKDEIIPEAKRATRDADNAAKSADAVLDKIAQKEYGTVKLTANDMKALIESGKVNNGLKYLVVSNNRVVGVYYGKMPQAGCELAVINETLVGRSTI